MPNRLAQETSPYLRQHADNPVDWYPWSDEAFERARSEDKAVLLSVGYSACHWCHVMAHESFEHPETAALMNSLFVNVKVDREERPDVDDIYMNAVQAMTGHGGWPMTVFLLPDGRPFWGGTYFPREPRYGMPSFSQILHAIHDAYANRRAEVEQAAASLTQALDNSLLDVGTSADDLTTTLLDRAVYKLVGGFDEINGGFGGAPKFPQPMNFAFLLAHYVRTGNTDPLDVVTHTLRKMARGGMYDQIGGGFARYSVDEKWLVPHFEKMLYDNAQLSRLYLHAWQVTGDRFFKAIAEETYDYILREMTSPEGGFYSATDADSEGEEGKFFVWTIPEIESLLSADDARVAIAFYGMTPGGNFEGKNILNVPREPEDVAAELGMSADDLAAAVDRIKHTLYAARSHRIHPGLDDKVLTAWNGLMLGSLAEAARVLDRDDYRSAAIRAGEFLTSTMVDQTANGPRLLRTYNHGKAKLNGVLEDYACLAEGLLDLYMTTFDPAHFDLARGLTDRALAHFRAEDGGFFDVSDDHEALIVRPRSLQDNAVPSGSGKLCRVLALLSAYTGDPRYDDAARAALRLLVSGMSEYPQAFGESLGAVELLAGGMIELALVGPNESPAMRALTREAWSAYRPNLIAAHAGSDAPVDHPIPLLAGRAQRDGKPTAYVCRQFACKLPVTEPAALRSQLESMD
ncbi:MAG: thioredoxin domain-containing protein [Chloroflexi bacterium]|nr:thioredoxin domain-containing protein [Chloroflexota bacterium]